MSDNITIVSRSTTSSTHSGDNGVVLPAALPDQTTVTNPEIVAAGATTATGVTASSAALAAQNATSTTGSTGSSINVTLLPQPQSQTQQLLQPPPLNPTKSPAYNTPSTTIPLAQRIQLSRRSIRNVQEYEAAFAALVRDSQARMEKVELPTIEGSSSLPMKVAPKAISSSSLSSNTMDLASILAKRKALYPSLYHAESDNTTTTTAHGSNESLQAKLRSYAVELPKAAPTKAVSSTTSSTTDKRSIALGVVSSSMPLSTDGAADNRKRTRDESEDATVKATNEEGIDTDKGHDGAAATMLVSNHASPPLKIAKMEDATSSAEVASTTGNDVLANSTDGIPTAPATTNTNAPDGQQPMLSVSSSTPIAQASIKTTNADSTSTTTPKLETDASTIAPANTTNSLGNPSLADVSAGSVAADDVGTVKPVVMPSMASTEQKTPTVAILPGHNTSATNTNTNSGSLPVATNSATTTTSATTTIERPETLAGGQPPIPSSNVEISGATTNALNTASQQPQPQPQFSHLPLPPPLPFPAGLQPPPLPQTQPGAASAAMATLPPQPALQAPPQPRFYTDIWGRFPAKEPSYLIECSVCKSTKVNALRFASHLDKCLGIRTMGRSAAAAAAASAAAASSTFHGNNSINTMAHSSHAK